MLGEDELAALATVLNGLEVVEHLLDALARDENGLLKKIALLVRRYYEELIAAGFTKDEAIQLVTAFARNLQQSST